MDELLEPHGEVVAKHYMALADNYDAFLTYSPDFIRRMTKKMIEKLDLREDDVFVDLGGGTGIYSADILRQVRLRQPVLLVEPFAEMAERAPKECGFRWIQMGALEFSEADGRYDKILMKEAVHHIADKVRLFDNLSERLSPGGRLLLVHVPPGVDYPLFRRALERSKRWHADPGELVELLKQAGFAADREAYEYPHRLPKETYFRMVRGRYMSLISSFEDDELEAGLAEMAETYRDRDVLEFVDHFDFITATKR